MKACMLYESASLEFSTKVGGAAVGKGSIQYNHELSEIGTIVDRNLVDGTNEFWGDTH